MAQMLFSKIQQAPGTNFGKVEKSLIMKINPCKPDILLGHRQTVKTQIRQALWGVWSGSSLFAHTLPTG